MILASHLKSTEKEEQIKPRVIRRKERIKTVRKSVTYKKETQ